MDENNIEFLKPKDKKYNRRSSFIRRKSLSSVNSDSPTSCGARDTLLIQQGDVTRTQEEIEAEYLSKLKKEEEDWKELVYQKTKEEEELSEKRPRATLSVDLLTEEDKKFLADRPNYAAIGRLVDNVTESVAIKQRRINSTMEKVKSFIADREQISDELARDVIDYFMEDFDEFGDSAPASL